MGRNGPESRKVSNNRWIEENAPLSWLLKIAEVSKAGYYKWRKTHSARSLRLEKNLWIKEHILAIHKLHPYYGYKRMTGALSREGIVVNHKRVRRLMRELGVQSVIRKKRPFYGRRGSVKATSIGKITTSKLLSKKREKLYLCQR